MALPYPLRTLRGPDGPGNDGIPYAERGDYSETFGKSETQAVRVLQVAWSQRHQFLRAILPRVKVKERIQATRTTISQRIAGFRPDYAEPDFTFNFVDRYKLERLDPEPHPRLPWLYASEATITGEGAPVVSPDKPSAIHFQQGPSRAPAVADEAVAKIIVTYRSVPYDIGAVSNDFCNAVTTGADGRGSEIRRYVSRQFKPATDTFTVPKDILHDFSGAAYTPGEPGPHVFGPGLGGAPAAIALAELASSYLIGESLAKVLAKAHVVYTWHMVPEIPISAGVLMGTVCSSPDFDQFGLSDLCPTVNRHAGQSLYLYPEIGDWYYLCDGKRVRDIKYHCLFRDPMHNMIFRGSRLGKMPRGFSPDQRYKGFVLASRNTIGMPGLTPAELENFSFHRDRPLGNGESLYNYGFHESLFRLCTTKALAVDP